MYFKISNLNIQHFFKYISLGNFQSRIIGLSIGCDVFNINITLPCENESHGNETPSRENNSSRRDLAKRLRIILNIESESEFEEQLENKLEKLGTQAPIGRAIKIVLLDLFHRHPKVSKYVSYYYFFSLKVTYFCSISSLAIR